LPIAQLQEQPCESRFDACTGELGQPPRQLGETQRQSRQQAADQRRLGLEELEERALLDAESLGSLEREG
jgi:hypothetical protein